MVLKKEQNRDSMKVLILHGWGGTPRGSWRGWLADQLTVSSSRFRVLNPELPNADHPKQDEWLAKIRETKEAFDGETILIGHSLGAVAILRLLESFGDHEKIKAAILVCGFTNDLGIEEINDFFKSGFDWEKIRNGAKKFVIINSDNDPYMKIEEGKILHEKLGGELIIEHNAGHINEDAGFKEYPRLLEIIRSI
jgi:predicted alpha/beta hydrolase family esterase